MFGQVNAVFERTAAPLPSTTSMRSLSSCLWDSGELLLLLHAWEALTKHRRPDHVGPCC